MKPLARLATVTVVLVCLLALNFGPGSPTPTVAQQQAAAELPQRVFQDLLVAPHQGLGQALGAAVSADGTPDPKDAALIFADRASSGLLAAASDLSWKVEVSEPLDEATTVVRLSQGKGGVPVFGAGLAVQVQGDSVSSVSGAYVPSISVGTKPALSTEEAFKLAREALTLNPPILHDHDHELDEEEAEHEANPFVKPVLAESELVLFNPALFDLAPAPTALAYRLVLTAPDDSQSVTAIVDALTGKVHLTYANYHSALSRVVRDANNVTTTGGSDCYRDTGPVGTPSTDCVAAFQNTGATYNYFLNTHNRDSFNNAGAQMIAVVRYGNVPNAFWNGQLTAYGPGFATRDVVAHEWAHAVTQYTAGLIYQNQSGALNESFSDIFGAMVDRDDWQMGEDTPIGAIRNLANPPAHNQPDKVSNYSCTTGDNGGVHINSGIPNKLAYLMSDGGSFNGRTVTAIGRDATERIFYRALVGGLTARSTFADLNSALLAAAAALHGENSTQYTATVAAAQAVELNQALPCGGGGTATPDGFEDDDNANQARPVATDGTPHQPHNFHEAGDQDWLRFTATSGTPYVIETFDLQSAADTVLTLYASNGTTQLAINDDAGGSLASRIAWTATASGNLLVKVTNYGGQGGANTGYKVRVTASTPQGGQDEFEPDDSRAAARPITVGGAAQNHNFHVAGDRDWVSFSATSGTPYVIETFDLGAASDTILELFNSAGERLAFNDDIPGSLASRITWTAPANGNFSVQVRHFSGAASGSTTSYKLRVLGTAPSGDSFEPDNSLAQARAITLGGATERHTFHIPGDQDWVYFDATTANAYQIDTLNLATGSDTVLELYNASNALLASNDDFVGLASRISYSPSSAQRLYVKVRHYSSGAGNPNMGYDLRITQTPVSGADQYEPDNSPAQAFAATPGSPENPQTLRHNFHIPGDDDWARFTAIAGNAYVFETTSLEDRADTVIDLFAPDGTQPIVSDDDGGEGLASRIVWTATGDGTFFLRVRGYSQAIGGANTGYTLRLATTGTSAGADEFEPDNTAATAKPITSGGAGQVHNFHAASDEDWVVFTAASGTQYLISTSRLGTRADTILELYNDAGTSLLASNDDADGLASRITWTAPAAGNYRIKVRQFNPGIFGANTNYTLNLVGASDSYEPDNSQAAARAITVNSPTPQPRTFHVAGDLDWVSFGAQAGSVYTIQTGNLGPCSDTVLDLYDSGGALLASNDDFNGLASRIVWRATGTGNLFVRVRHYSSGTFGPCSSYELRVDGTADAGDSYEPDNTRDTARPITINGAAQSHNFHVAGDNDWVVFNSVPGATYTISTSQLGTCSDTVLDLTDSSNNVLASNDDAVGLASRIVWISRGSEQLLVRVRHFYPPTSGACTSYNLAVTATEAALDAFEPDNTVAAARAITVGAPAQTHNFHAVDDVDWVRFAAAAGTTYTLQTSNLGVNADTVLELYNDAGNSLLASNDDFTGLASRIVWTAQASGNYTVRVRPYGSTGGRPNTNYDLRIVTGTALAEGTPVAPASAVTRATSGDNLLPPAADGQLRLTGAELEGAVQVGAEFTTVIQAQGSATALKLSSHAKSAYLELVAVQPLDSTGSPLDLEKHPDGPPWSAQGSGANDVAIYEPWSSAEPSPLIALRWRVVAQPESKRLELPITVVARAADGTSWEGGVVTLDLPVAGEIKVEAMSPAELTLNPTSYLSVRVSGLAGELPKLYLVDVESSAEQQVVTLSYAPGSSDSLIGTIDGTFKPGTYKVRVAVDSGASATSSETLRIVAEGAANRVFIPFIRR